MSQSVPLVHDWGYLSPEETRKLQSQKLHRFLNEQVYPFSPFYQKLFDQENINPAKIQSVDDLKHIPFTSKKDIAPTPENPTAPRGIVLQPDKDKIKAHWSLGKKLPLGLLSLLGGPSAVKNKLGQEYRPVMATFTTGRSAEPTAFVYSDYDLEIMKATGRRLMDVLTCNPEEDKGYSVFPFAPHLAFWQTFFAGFAGGMFFFHSGGGRSMGTGKILVAMAKMQPTLLVGVPGYCYHLLRRAHAEGMDLSFIKTVAMGGDAVPDGLKEKMRDLLAEMNAPNVNVLSILGFTESRQCWGECPHHETTGFHTYPDLAIFEMINPDTGEVLPEGETGEMVFTGLDGRGSCLIRYRTGDLVQGGLTTAPCPGCGRTVPRIGTDIRRFSNVKDFHLSKVKGTLVDFNNITHLLTNHTQIEEWQLEITKKNDDPFDVDEMTLHISLRGEVEEASFIDALKRDFITSVEVAPNRVNIESLDELLRRTGMEDNLKEVRILDNRPKAE